LLSYLLSILALIAYASQWAKSVREKGKTDQVISNLENECSKLEDRVMSLEAFSACQDGDIKAINSDIKHILESLKRIERKLDKDVPE